VRTHGSGLQQTNVNRRNTVISEAIAATPAQIGFRTTIALDRSPKTRDATRLAVSRAREGDREAMRYLYVSYSNNVYGYVRSIVRDDHDAEDVTQQVFAKLMTILGKYDDRGGPFLSWLLRLARNVAIDHLRANRITPAEVVPDPDALSAAEPEQAETVRAALAMLPEEQRKVVMLRHAWVERRTRFTAFTIVVGELCSASCSGLSRCRALGKRASSLLPDGVAAVGSCEMRLCEIQRACRDRCCPSPAARPGTCGRHWGTALPRSGCRPVRPIHFCSKACTGICAMSLLRATADARRPTPECGVHLTALAGPDSPRRVRGRSLPRSAPRRGLQHVIASSSWVASPVGAGRSRAPDVAWGSVSSCSSGANRYPTPKWVWM
jgi:RNA polymerase sigma-70 factor, ECF subfamily